MANTFTAIDALSAATAAAPTDLLALGQNSSGTYTFKKITIAALQLQQLVVSVAYASTITPNTATTKILKVGALTGNVTLAIPSGTPYDQQVIEIVWLQDGTGGRTLTLATGYDIPSSSTLSSPISQANFTAANARTRMAIQYDSASGKWDVVSFVPGY